MRARHAFYGGPRVWSTRVKKTTTPARPSVLHPGFSRDREGGGRRYGREATRAPARSNDGRRRADIFCRWSLVDVVLDVTFIACTA